LFFQTNHKPSTEGDLVLLREVATDPKLKLLRHGLKPNGRVETHKGAILHSDIISSNVNSIIRSNRGTKYTATEPTLGEYITLSSRLVAPIYPDDANLIVNLLDLHPDPEGARIDIFEAGTGHGALTLHLARALHAANTGTSSNAKIHTMDISEKHSIHARKVVNDFKNGIYTRDIEFHVGTPSEFLASTAGEKRWLTHAILDMPGSHKEMGVVAEHVVLGGKMVLFTPSITQLIDAQREVRENELPLYLERVIELGGGISGGREWSLKFVKSRASMRAASTPLPTTSEESTAETGLESEDRSDADSAVDVSGGSDEPEWVVSCRPKPGKMIQGGGFVGLWTRVEERGSMGDADSGFSKGLRDRSSSDSGIE
jgi:tRNA A58 N-methylase Trm61